ncbi:MAG: DUF1778 domain-containing protein, partial [Blastocatellia bacterium]
MDIAIIPFAYLPAASIFLFSAAAGYRKPIGCEPCPAAVHYAAGLLVRQYAVREEKTMPTKTEKSLKAKKKSSAKKARLAKRAKSVKSAKSRSVRLDMRINFQAKSLIERAATLTGQTVTDFAVSNL